MNVYTKTKVLFKFCILEIMCVEMRSKKQLKNENDIEADTLRMKNISFVSC